MGVEILYTGKMNIPEEKREILAKQMEKVLNFGGMMRFENVNLFDTTVGLMQPFSVNPKGDSRFYYNYFEDAGWETGCFNRQDGTLSTGKVGGEEFHDVSMAAYLLLSMYDTDPGCPAAWSGFFADTYAVQWLNHILGAGFSMKPHFNLFDNAWKYASMDYDSPYLEESSTDHLLPAGLEYWACGTDYADLMYIFRGTGSLDQGDVLPGTYADDVRKAREAVRSLLKQGGKDSLKRLWTLLKSDREKRMEMTDLSPLPELSLILPARVFVYLAAEQRDLEFWEVWAKLRKQVYHDQQMKSYVPESLERTRREIAEGPLSPVSTLSFLKRNEIFIKDVPGVPRYSLSDDDRLYWWDPESDEVTLSVEAKRWLWELSLRHRTIMESLEKNPPDPDSFLGDFVNVLGRVNNAYVYVYPFQSMFYEFIRNGSRKEYAAAVKLFKQLARENWKKGKIVLKADSNWSLTSKSIRCNPGKMRLRRYLSVMANTKLRKKYFGF